MKKVLVIVGIIATISLATSCSKERECMCMTMLSNGEVQSTNEVTVKGETCEAHSNTTDYYYVEDQYSTYRIYVHEVCVEK